MLSSYAVQRVWLWFFPRRCVWCRGVTEPERMLCADCEPKVASTQNSEPLPGMKNAALLSCFPYRSPAGKLMLHVKFTGGHKYAPSIGYCMGDVLRAELPRPEDWLLTCVPMTAAQVKARGYNQSELLAGFAAKWAGLRFAPGLLEKSRETDTQHTLPAPQRAANVAGAFACPKPERARGQRVVLCDDICTTGATLRACAKALQQAGAAEVLCLAFLRTGAERALPPSKEGG